MCRARNTDRACAEFAYATSARGTEAVELETTTMKREVMPFGDQVSIVVSMITLDGRDDSQGQARDDECAKHDFGESDLEARRIMCDARLRTYLRMDW